MNSSEELQNGFLADIVDISPLIEDYMAAKLYELEVEYSDGVDDHVLFNLVLGMVLGELSTMGIEIFGGTDIYNDPTTIELIKVLRSEFDIKNLRRTLLDKDDFKVAIESASQEWDEDNIIHTVSAIAIGLFPLSTKWKFIHDNSLNCASTHSLERHILRLIDSIESGVFSDNEEDELIARYTEAISMQRAKFINYVSILRKEVNVIEDVVRHEANIILDEALMTYDIDLINNMHPDNIGIYLDRKDPHPAYRGDGQEDIELVKHHKRLHNHHVECLYAKKMISGTLSQDAPYILLLVADGYREPWTYEQNIDAFEKYTKPLNLSDTAMDYARQWIRLISSQ